ncbi:hypothetical protein STCU_10423 [Strigomonas culicis]|uniref:Uncharacterized protein n=1 Tax=Strigomonas culicis TaxID=28005 RepID=S9TI56_9TRYP|nr:hypothetical protein STCU_10423 [Strigomonas culicis]|eukprot:EPY17752.1 hypothetical protein STCU_10423 [Strigomonas culicis]
MALLLDDEDEVISESHKVAVAPKPSPVGAQTNAADTLTFFVKGGNGIDKMEALAFGSAKVQVSGAATPASKRPRPVAVTQPKLVSPSSPSTEVSAARRSASNTSGVNDQAVLVSDVGTVEGEKAPPPPEAVSRQIAFREEAEVKHTKKEVTEVLPDVVKKEAAPVKQQMKLSDFFSKMACKR